MQLAFALAPIALLIVLLTAFRMKAWKAALVALAVAIVLAVVGFDLPLTRVAPVIAGGVGFALYPISTIILAALFVYSLTVESGAMATIKSGLLAIGADRRVQALVIVWGFGNFMEGMAGFGTAVAIPAAILVGVGFDPLKAVMMCLVANTTPTVFGSVGVPLMTLAKESGVEPHALSWACAALQAMVTALGPFLVLLVLDGPRALKGMVGKALIADVAFLVPWMLAARFFGGELPDILGGVFVIFTFVALSPKAISAAGFARQSHAWAPFGFVVAFLAIALALPPSLRRFAPPPLVVLAAGFAGGFVQGLAWRRMANVLWQTFLRYWTAFATICAVLALARTMGEAGMISTIASALVKVAGSAYPFVAPLVGALGGFVTGSGTSSNVLFGALQAKAASELSLAPSLLAAANVMGAGIGKMICPQSIAIGVAAAGIASRSGETMQKVAPWFFAVLALASLVTGLAALWL